MAATITAKPRHDWTRTEVEALFDLSFPELMFRAGTVHRANFDADEIQLSQLLSVKTGGYAENCGHCSQSAHFETGLKAPRLMSDKELIATAAQAKANGAQRFCMGAAWRELKDRDLSAVAKMISEVKALAGERNFQAPHCRRVHYACTDIGEYQRSDDYDWRKGIDYDF
jgi:biotin synthase